ncbi:MAG: hypothetical protein HY040_15355 [Planctomycetes bacterium]|nr:hypothetical protein [Planctomycetota bacterium]
MGIKLVLGAFALLSLAVAGTSKMMSHATSPEGACASGPACCASSSPDETGVNARGSVGGCCPQCKECCNEEACMLCLLAGCCDDCKDCCPTGACCPGSDCCTGGDCCSANTCCQTAQQTPKAVPQTPKAGCCRK